MIYAAQKDLNGYQGISHNLDTAIDFILSGKPESLSPGKNAVDGDEVYAMSFEYDTIPVSDGFFEAHLQYADIHIVLSGCESIGVTHIDQLTELDRKLDEDYIKLEGTIRVLCPLSPGEALVVFPEDAHMVKLQTNGPDKVHKAVIKVKM